MNFHISSEFLTIAIIHLLAMASPGPDFAIVLKNSVVHGRRAGIATSIGIGLGIAVHVAYCVIGLGIVISQSIIAFTIIKIAGALYLIFIGLGALRSKKSEILEKSISTEQVTLTSREALWSGFLTNVLNPKVTLFFLAIFSVTVSPETSVLVRIGYGVWMMVVSAIWFSLLSTLFSQQQVRSFLDSSGHWFERIMGGALIMLGLRLAVVKNH